MDVPVPLAASLSSLSALTCSSVCPLRVRNAFICSSVYPLLFNSESDSSLLVETSSSIEIFDDLEIPSRIDRELANASILFLLLASV